MGVGVLFERMGQLFAPSAYCFCYVGFDSVITLDLVPPNFLIRLVLHFTRLELRAVGFAPNCPPVVL